MSDNQKKIKVKFPLISYDMIEEAAELSGCSVKAFAANAILEAAMRTVQGMDDFTYGDLDNIELTEDEAKALLGLVDAMDVEDAKEEEVEDVKAEEKVEEKVEEAKEEAPAEEPKVEEVVEAKEDVKVEEPVAAPAPAAKPARKGKKRARK